MIQLFNLSVFMIMSCPLEQTNRNHKINFPRSSLYQDRSHEKTLNILVSALPSKNNSNNSNRVELLISVIIPKYCTPYRRCHSLRTVIHRLALLGLDNAKQGYRRRKELREIVKVNHQLYNMSSLVIQYWSRKVGQVSYRPWEIFHTTGAQPAF